jgi:hypothetical protein
LPTYRARSATHAFLAFITCGQTSLSLDSVVYGNDVETEQHGFGEPEGHLDVGKLLLLQSNILD